jgi:hypothetical protein
LPLTRLGSVARGGHRVESHGAELPLAALDAAAFVIASSSQPADSPEADSAHLLVQAATPALVTLARRCRSGGK